MNKLFQDEDEEEEEDDKPFTFAKKPAAPSQNILPVLPILKQEPPII